MRKPYRLRGSTPRREWRLLQTEPGLLHVGETHRKCGPAIEFDNGYKMWYWYGNHRTSQGGDVFPFQYPQGYDWSDIANFPGYESYAP